MRDASCSPDGNRRSCVSAKCALIARAVAGRELPKTLAAEEVDALMRIPNRSAPTGLRNLCMLTLMHRSGLRVSEVCGLYLRDVRWRDGQIHLRPEITKGGREAVAYLDPHTEELLRRWKDMRQQYAAGKPHLFTTLQGGPVSRHYCWQMMQRYGRRAGLERRIFPHILRHTFATELLREGFNVREVQRLLRHADIRTTVLYTHLVDAELQKKIRERSVGRARA
jgi:integrase/recombinase XerD